MKYLFLTSALTAIAAHAHSLVEMNVFEAGSHNGCCEDECHDHCDCCHDHDDPVIDDPVIDDEFTCADDIVDSGVFFDSTCIIPYADCPISAYDLTLNSGGEQNSIWTAFIGNNDCL